jgi:hypothetical protein
MPTVCAIELFMMANVFDWSDVVDEEGIATKENRLW